MADSHPEPTYPPGHEFGMRVPKGGSSCEGCHYVRVDEASPTRGECGNHYWRRWNNWQRKIPAPIDSYCCDAFEAKRG